MRNLSVYQGKRDFRKTKEPKPSGACGLGPRTSSLSFVVQKHAARRLHYDFRLELNGVLLSWAVPKGPSTAPRVKRLAQQTEDHPLEYGGFEGTIPQGEYGGGTVMLWDRGVWIPEGDPRAQYDRGRLTFEVKGERLQGRWHLVRTRGEKGKSWLLFKGRDEHASSDNDAFLENATTSVSSARTMLEIGQKRPAVSDRGTLPAVPRPQLATLVDTAPDGDSWLHEVKLDGYRLIAWVRDGEVSLLTRGGNDWTKRAPRELVETIGKVRAHSALLDGELVAFEEDGVSNFQRLQNALGEGAATRLSYCAFDLLHLDGHDLYALPLENRKELLRSLLHPRPSRSSARKPTKLGASELVAEATASKDGALRFSEHVEGNGPEFLRVACQLGLEGIVSKRRDSQYRPGRSRDWLKTKCESQQEFVIDGFTEPSGSRKHLGALLLGVWEGGQLLYSGKVGTGFTQSSEARVGRAQELQPSRGSKPRATCPGALPGDCLQITPQGKEFRGLLA